MLILNMMKNVDRTSKDSRNQQWLKIILYKYEVKIVWFGVQYIHLGLFVEGKSK